MSVRIWNMRQNQKERPENDMAMVGDYLSRLSGKVVKEGAGELGERARRTTMR
jgi:hypothetical protein